VRAPNNRGRGNAQVPVVCAVPRSKCGRGGGSPCPCGPGRRDSLRPPGRTVRCSNVCARPNEIARPRPSRAHGQRVRSDLGSSLLDLTLELWTIESSRTNVAFLPIDLAARMLSCPNAQPAQPPRPPTPAQQQRGDRETRRYMVRGSGCGDGRKSAARLWEAASGRVEAQRAPRACVGRHEMDQDGPRWNARVWQWSNPPAFYYSSPNPCI
jgi:hypothetical protein